MAESLVREDKPKLYRTIEEIVQTIVKVSATKARGAYEPFVFKDCKVAYVLPGFDVTQDVSLGDGEKPVLFQVRSRQSQYPLGKG